MFICQMQWLILKAYTIFKFNCPIYSRLFRTR